MEISLSGGETVFLGRGPAESQVGGSVEFQEAKGKANLEYSLAS